MINSNRLSDMTSSYSTSVAVVVVTTELSSPTWLQRQGLNFLNTTSSTQCICVYLDHRYENIGNRCRHTIALCQCSTNMCCSLHAITPARALGCTAILYCEERVLFDHTGGSILPTLFSSWRINFLLDLYRFYYLGLLFRFARGKLFWACRVLSCFCGFPGYCLVS